MQTTNSTRRIVLKGTAVAAAFGVSGIAQLLTMSNAHAAWPKKAFASESISDVMQALFNEDVKAIDSNKVELSAPDIAENGAVVPIGVSSSLPDIKRIIILVDGNPSPMTAAFNLGPGAIADVSTRIKMGQTSDVIALVESAGKVYAARKNVKVTIGGCGG